MVADLFVASVKEKFQGWVKINEETVLFIGEIMTERKVNPNKST